MDFEIVLITGAAAAIGIVRRRGLGRVRHLDVTDLWLQGKVRSKDIIVEKVAGADNPADALTKALARPILVKHLMFMGLHPEEGRAASAPKLPDELP